MQDIYEIESSLSVRHNPQARINVTTGSGLTCARKAGVFVCTYVCGWVHQCDCPY